jgi:putative hydrolase of the HAD superfamily
VSLRAVLFDVDFTLAKPGPLLGPEGYKIVGERHGLALDTARHSEARLAAIEDLEHHPELDHDEQIWLRFTEDIVRGMGGFGDAVRRVAFEIVKSWEDARNFELYEDALPVLGVLRARGLKLGLVSNTSRDLDLFCRHFEIDVDAWISSGAHGKVKPSPSIFRTVLEALSVAAGDTVMVGDSMLDDVEGARALGMRAVLVDREGRFPEWPDRVRSLRELPGLLGVDPGP